MKKLLLIQVIIISICSSQIQSQTIFQEDFESGIQPTGWEQQTNASDNGWKFGTPSALSSQYWTIASNGSLRIAATNDDACNCNKRNDYLITPPISFAGLTRSAVSVDVFFSKGEYQGFIERATIKASTDLENWTILKELEGKSGWNTYKINLSEFNNEDSLFLAFHYDDMGGWVFGLAIDNVLVYVPPLTDASLIKLKSLPYGVEGKDILISGILFNNGIDTITSFDLNYSVNGGAKVQESVSGVSIPPFTEYEFAHPVFWNPTIGVFDVTVEVSSVNSLTDEDSLNNSLSFTTEIFPVVTIPNRINEFLSSDPIYTTIASSADGLDKPTDLDFFPILAKNELWIVNERIESSGGSTLTIYDAGTSDQKNLTRTDGNAWHFMSLPTAIAFSDNFNFGISPGVKDANHNNGTFTGPSLWTSDSLVYALPSGGNGSHLDMLHGSPYSMGIASDTANVFWVFDGWNSTIVRYDFQGDHGPGNDDHSDGLVRRYSEIAVKRDGFVPSHLVLDKNSGWLYIVDNGNDRILRLDINSGNVATSLPLINEPLAEHSQMANATWEIIISDSLERPSGIEIIQNRLLISDYATGDIIIYDIENGFQELGRISTGQAGITGIKIGPDGNIWYTNRLQNSVVRIEPGEVTSVINSNSSNLIHISPNPTSGELFVHSVSELSQNARLTISDLAGRVLLKKEKISIDQNIDLSNLPNGIYTVTISTDSLLMTDKIILHR